MQCHVMYIIIDFVANFFRYNFHLCGNQNRCVSMIFVSLAFNSREAGVKRPNHAMRVKLDEFQTRTCSAFCVIPLLFCLVSWAWSAASANEYSAVQSGPLRCALLDKLAVCLVTC